MTIDRKKLLVPAVALAAFLGGAGVMVASAANAASGNPGTGTPPAPHGVTGTVSAVSGDSITLTGKDGKTYTINAAQAAVDKVSTISVGQIAAGDTLRVDGTVFGTNVTAAHIMDGTLPAHGLRGGFGRGGMGPGVVGTISAINGNSLTVAGKNGTTYTVDATSAKVMVFTQGSAPTTGSLSSLKVGDTVGVRGTVSGTNVTATGIVDGIPSMGMHRGW